MVVFQKIFEEEILTYSNKKNFLIIGVALLALNIKLKYYMAINYSLWGYLFY